METIRDYLFTVPNTTKGRAKIAAFRQILNKKRYKLVLRGRGKNRMAARVSVGLPPRSTCTDMPLRTATTIAVYLHESESYKRKKRMERSIDRVLYNTEVPSSTWR